LYEPAVFVRAACTVLELLYAGHPKLAMMAELATRLEQQAADDLLLLTDEERSSLHARLRPVADLGHGDLSVIVHSVSGNIPVAAEEARTLGAALHALEGAARPKGSVPAVVQFLAALASTRSEVYKSVWAWIDECAGRLEIAPDELARLRAGWPAAPQSQRVRVALSIVDENPRSIGRYRLSRWLHGADGRVSHKRDEGVPRSKEELSAGGEAMLAEFHEIFQSAEADVVEVEFFLPGSVINLDVDRWHVGSEASAPRVGNLFPVVIHSADRMRDGLYHAAWKKRWQVLTRSPHREAAQWMRWKDQVPPTGDLIPELSDYDALSALLADRESLCCLGLHECGELVVQITAAIQAGVPAVIWRRDGGDVAELRSLLAELADDGRLAELPTRVTDLRRRARGRREHAGSNVSLIWDDYNDRTAFIAGWQPPQVVQGADNDRT
jgi:hypothetical protein